jgi:hypothetical protein
VPLTAAPDRLQSGRVVRVLFADRHRLQSIERGFQLFVGDLRRRQQPRQRRTGVRLERPFDLERAVQRVDPQVGPSDRLNPELQLQRSERRAPLRLRQAFGPFGEPVQGADRPLAAAACPGQAAGDHLGTLGGAIGTKRQQAGPRAGFRDAAAQLLDPAGGDPQAAAEPAELLDRPDVAVGGEDGVAEVP